MSKLTTYERYLKALELNAGNYSVEKACKKAGLSLGTYYRYRAEAQLKDVAPTQETPGTETTYTDHNESHLDGVAVEYKNFRFYGPPASVASLVNALG